MITPDSALTVFSAFAASFGAVGSLGWWLSGRFRAVEQVTAATIAKHEAIDQERHEENLARFEKVNISLATLIHQPRHRGQG